MPPTLRIHEATVQTVQVEIKALKVGKKQVTMGLFRQLPRATLLDPDTLQLRGLPWGWVNYWWDADGSVMTRSGSKLHVVWQAQDELRRAIVYEEPSPGHMQDFHEREQEVLNDWVLQQLQHAQQFHEGQGGGFSGRRTVTLDDKRYAVSWDDATSRVVSHYWHGRQIDPPTLAAAHSAWHREHRPTEYEQQFANVLAMHERQKQEAIAAYTTLLRQRGLTDSTTEELRQAWQEVQNQRAAYAARWTAQWQTLKALPQLFIAV